jgi:Tfp pilus assembly protein PilP
MMRTMAVVPLLLATLLAGLAGAQEQPAAPTPATTPRQEVLFTLEPVPGEFQYDESGRKDPFDSLLRLKEIEVDLSKLPEIQRIDTAALQVKGIVIIAGRPPMASLFDPATKKYYSVSPGDMVGKNQGEVTSISTDGIVIQEKFKDFLGKITTRDVVLMTSKPIKIDTKGGTP